MKTKQDKPAGKNDEQRTTTGGPFDHLSRREFLATSAVVGATLLVPGVVSAALEGKKTGFTILHTNDMHSAFVGMGPSLDYKPFELGQDATRGGFARIAGLIAKRKTARKGLGPVLVLDAGDYSMGTPFGAATREIGGELQLMARMGYDATTFGNHEFDYGPEGLGKATTVAVKAGRIPMLLASNTVFSKDDATLTDLQNLAKQGLISRYHVIERGGIRFGLFGVLGKEAIFYTNGGAISFSDAVETAREMVKVLRESEKVDIVIALSHGGVEKGQDGRYTTGDDVHLAEAVPGIDVVIGGHSHTELSEPILVNGRTPVVQTREEGQNLGELVISLDGGNLKVESYRLYPIDDTVLGDHSVADEIETFKKSVTGAVFASRGYGRSAAGRGAAGSSQCFHRYRCWDYSRQSHLRCFQDFLENGYWPHRQWPDARWYYSADWPRGVTTDTVEVAGAPAGHRKITERSTHSRLSSAPTSKTGPPGTTIFRNTDSSPKPKPRPLTVTVLPSPGHGRDGGPKDGLVGPGGLLKNQGNGRRVL